MFTIHLDSTIMMPNLELNCSNTVEPIFSPKKVPRQIQRGNPILGGFLLHSIIKRAHLEKGAFFNFFIFKNELDSLIEYEKKMLDPFSKLTMSVEIFIIYS